jgi:drug/metabolite transporter (DMT)-like permease
MHEPALADDISSVPLGAVAIILIYFAMPAGFPYGPGEKFRTNQTTIQDSPWKLLRKRLHKIDILGAFLLLLASFCLFSALLEACIAFKWSSSADIALLTFAGVFWVSFFAWEWYIDHVEAKQEAIFPWKTFSKSYLDRYADVRRLSTSAVVH